MIFKTIDNNKIVKSISQYKKLNNSISRYNGLQNKSQSFQNAYNKSLQNSTSSLGKYLSSLNGANASIGGYIKYLVSAKASTIALTVASTAMNIALTAGVSVVLGLLASKINEWVHAQEEARKKSVELTETYKEQQTSLDEQIEKYKELKKSLDNGNLSTEESRSIKEQLLEIQSSLIESYGIEASNIDLVNGKYKEQLGILGKISKEKADKYVKENRSAFEDAKNELEKVRSYKIGSIFSYGRLDGMSDAQKQLYDYIKSYSDLFEIRSMYDTSTLRNSDNAPTLFVNANADDAKSIIDEFYSDIEKYINENNLQLDYNSLQIDLSKVSSNIETNDVLKDYREIYDEFMKAEVIRSDTLRPLYKESIDAVENYNEALASGKEVEEAKEKLDSVKESVSSATEELEGSQKIFDEIYQNVNQNAEVVYELGKAFEDDSAVKRYAEQLRGLTDIDLKAINFNNDTIEEGEEAFRRLLHVLGLTKDQSQLLIDKLIELGYVQGEVITPETDEPVSTTYEDLAKSVETASEAFNSVKSAISSVNDAFAEQNEYGSISVDTMLSLVDAGYATALSFDAATGACTLNKDAMLELVKVKIQDQIEDLKKLKSNIGKKLLEDGIAASVSALGFYDLAKAKSLAANAEQIASMENYNDATAQIKAMENALKNIDKMEKGLYSTSFSSAKSATKKAETDWKKFLDNELNLARANFDAGLTDFSAYMSKRKNILDRYLAESKISHADYLDYIKKGYEEEKSFYDSVLSAVTKRFDREIDAQQAVIDGIEKENAALEKQKENYDKIVSAVLDTIDAKKDEIQSSIDALEKENDAISKQVDEYDSVISAVQEVYEAKQDELKAEQDAIQERIDALRDENDENKRAIELQKARYELERSMNQRSKMVYNGEQFVYMADDQAVRENREKVGELEFENTIASLEKEKEALQELIDDLDHYKNLWSDIADSYQRAKDADIARNILGENYEEGILLNRIEDIEAFKNRYVEAQTKIDDNTSLIESYEEKIGYYDGLKKKWEELSGAHEININRQLAKEQFGAEWEALILEDRLEGFDEFKNSYLGIQEKINDNTGLIESYKEKIDYYQKLKNEWGAVASAYEDSVNDQHAAMLLGQTWEADILSGRITTLNQFKKDYARIQEALLQIDVDRYNAQVETALNAEKLIKSGNASISSGEDIGGNYSGPISGGRDDSFDDIDFYRIVDSKTGKIYKDKIESKQTAEQWIGRQEESGRYTGSIIGRMKVEKYANGGVISDLDSNYLDWIAELCKEDHIVAVSNNERVLTEGQNRSFEKLVDSIPSLVADTYNPAGTPGFDMNEFNQTHTEQPVSFTMGDIHLHNVQNVDGLAKAIELSFPNTMMRRAFRRR